MVTSTLNSASNVKTNVTTGNTVARLTFKYITKYIVCIYVRTIQSTYTLIKFLTLTEQLYSHHSSQFLILLCNWNDPKGNNSNLPFPRQVKCSISSVFQITLTIPLTFYSHLQHLDIHFRDNIALFKERKIVTELIGCFYVTCVINYITYLTIITNLTIICYFTQISGE